MYDVCMFAIEHVLLAVPGLHTSILYLEIAWSAYQQMRCTCTYQCYTVVTWVVPNAYTVPDDGIIHFQTIFINVAYSPISA